jgi:hypothetical protein
MTTLEFRSKCRKLTIVAFLAADILFIAVVLKTIITIF